MNVIAFDKNIEKTKIQLDHIKNQNIFFDLTTSSLNHVLKESDFITLHIPKINDKPFIGEDEFDMMKTGVGIINTSRGGLIDESELIKFLNNKKVSFAALDVYENEPTPNIQLLMHDKISLSPHIGGSTVEAQERIGDEIVREIKAFINLMNKILPFKAVRAAEDKVGLFVTRNYQSYDKRTFKDKISNNPYSFLNIISKSNNSNNFSEIRKQFEKFIDEQILIKDKNESFYLYQISQDDKISIGIISLFSTSNLRNGILKKHENTIIKREKIFQRYLLETQINAEPVLIFHKENLEINKIIELYKKKNHTYNFTTTDRVNHKLWKISEKPLVEKIIINYNKINEFYIADGHHRVSSSNLISKKLKKETFFLSFLVSEKNIFCGSFIRYIDNIKYAHTDFLEEIKKSLS